MQPTIWQILERCTAFIGSGRPQEAIDLLNRWIIDNGHPCMHRLVWDMIDLVRASANEAIARTRRQTFKVEGRTIMAQLVPQRCNDNGNYVAFVEDGVQIDSKFEPATLEQMVSWWIEENYPACV